MPVPDAVVFGPDESRNNLTYGQIRKRDQESRFQALERRLELLFIVQVDHLTRRDDKDQRVVNSPFPLFLMTCVGIETFGKVFFTPEYKNGRQQEDLQRDGFLEICKRIDTKLSRPLSKEHKSKYDQLWGKDEHKKVKSTSHIIYRSGRHSMVHSYQGKGVYLTEDNSVPCWKLDNGAILINPYQFWECFKEMSTTLWKEFHENKEPSNPLKKSAKLYLDEMLE